MRRSNAYAVHYRAFSTGETKLICVGATSKAEAYDKAVYEAIPAVEGELPYSAWVSSVTYQNGNVKYFNTFEGNPY